MWRASGEEIQHIYFYHLLNKKVLFFSFLVNTRRAPIRKSRVIRVVGGAQHTEWNRLLSPIKSITKRLDTQHTEHRQRRVSRRSQKERGLFLLLLLLVKWFTQNSRRPLQPQWIYTVVGHFFPAKKVCHFWTWTSYCVCVLCVVCARASVHPKPSKRAISKINPTIDRRSV